MYNLQYKTEYLKTLNKTGQEKSSRLFKTIAVKEKKFEQDLFCFDKHTLIKVLKYTVGIKYATLEAIQRAINISLKYKHWMKINHPELSVVDIENGEISIDDIDNVEIYPYKFFKDGNDLLSILNQIFNTETTRGLCMIVTYLLIFNGLDLTTISFLKKEDMDFQKQLIHITKNQTDVYIHMIPEFIGFYYQVFNVTEYQGERKIRINTEYYLPLSSKKRIWHAAFNAEVKPFLCQAQIILEHNIQKNLPTQINLKLLEINSLLYRTYCFQCSQIKEFLPELNDAKPSNEIDCIYNKFLSAFYCA